MPDTPKQPTVTEAMIEAGCQASCPELFSGDAVKAYREASSIDLDKARCVDREHMKVVLEAALAAAPAGEVVGWLYDDATPLGAPACEGLKQERFSNVNPSQYFGASNIRPLYTHPPLQPSGASDHTAPDADAGSLPACEGSIPSAATHPPQEPDAPGLVGELDFDDEDHMLAIIERAWRAAGISRTPFFGEAYEPGEVVKSILEQVVLRAQPDAVAEVKAQQAEEMKAATDALGEAIKDLRRRGEPRAVRVLETVTMPETIEVLKDNERRALRALAAREGGA